MTKKSRPKPNEKQASKLKEPRAEYVQKKRLNFEAHATFDEMNEAKRVAFMKLSMAERFLKGLELYRMFKEENMKQADPNSYVLKKRNDAAE